MSILEDARKLKEQISTVESYIEKNNKLILKLADEVEAMKLTYEEINRKRLDLKEDYKLEMIGGK